MATVVMGRPDTGFVRRNIETHKASRQARWQWLLLLSVLGYEATGCLVGGSFLMAAPDGNLMDMPVRIMHGAFADFFIPGLILFSLGILNTFAFISVLRKQESSWLVANIALWGLAIWFVTEIAILQVVHWLHFMWGLPVLLGGVMTIPMIERETFRKILLACGIASSVLYVAVNLITVGAWPGYSMASQVPSELSAIGSPTRALWMAICTPYTVLVIAFGWGVLRSAFGERKLNVAGWLLIAYGGLGIFWPFAPMHMRDALAAGQGDIRDTMHLVLAGITQVLYLLSLIYVASALGRGFQWYSIGTFAVLLFFGILTFLEAPGLSENLPTPTIGIWERIDIGVFLLWMIVLADVLWRRKPAAQYVS